MNLTRALKSLKTGPFKEGGFPRRTKVFPNLPNQGLEWPAQRNYLNFNQGKLPQGVKLNCPNLRNGPLGKPKGVALGITWLRNWFGFPWLNGHFPLMYPG